MSELIDDILSFSRVANAELKQEIVNLSQLAKELAQEFQESEPERNIEWMIQDDLHVQGDKNLLRTVLQNLLGNAWKYSSTRKQSWIEFGQGTMNGQPCYFVKDNGVGFDMQSLPRLFKPFQRLHAKSEFPGTGIGLANVQRIISRHGGRVWAEGKPEEGATFYFCLPTPR